MAYKFYLDSLSMTPQDKRLAASSQSFSYWYKYWKDTLFNRCVHIFVWDTKGEIPNTELEKILMSGGTCGITNVYRNSKKGNDYPGGRLGVFYGYNGGGLTIYSDIYTKYYTVKRTGAGKNEYTVNKDIIMGWNNSLQQSIIPLCHSFAVLLAHCDVSIINKLINGREKTVPIAGSRTQLEALRNYRNDLCNGKISPIYDPALNFTDFKSIPSSNDMNISELQEFKKTTIEMFLNMIGVKTSYEKRGNMIEEEVNANDTMLMFNLEDMEARREEIRDGVNALFGREWDFKKSDALGILEGGVEYEESDS